MAPFERLYLGIPIQDKQSILASGYRKRGGINASKTSHDALVAFERSHSRRAACLSFAPPEAEQTDQGSGVYLRCSFLPPDSLQDVDAEKDNSGELLGSSVFWAVAPDSVHEILQGGVQPRHRRSLPVALDLNEAKRHYHSKGGSGTPCILRVRMEDARVAGFHVFEHDRGIGLHMPSTADKIEANLLELVESDGSWQSTQDTEDLASQNSEVAEVLDMQDMHDDTQHMHPPSNREFPRMKQGRLMWLDLLAGEGSDQSRWVPGRIVKGGASRAEVQVQVKQGRLSIAEQIYLDNPRVRDFHHPDACQLTDVETVHEAQVQALHDHLSAGGATLQNSKSSSRTCSAWDQPPVLDRF